MQIGLKLIQYLSIITSCFPFQGILIQKKSVHRQQSNQAESKKFDLRGSSLQALLILGGLVKTIISEDSVAGPNGLDRLNRISTAFGQVDSSPLSSFPSGVHHIVHFLLRSSRFVPHLVLSHRSSLLLSLTEETLINSPIGKISQAIVVYFRPTKFCNHVDRPMPG